MPLLLVGLPANGSNSLMFHSHFQHLDCALLRCLSRKVAFHVSCCLCLFWTGYQSDCSFPSALWADLSRGCCKFSECIKKVAGGREN